MLDIDSRRMLGPSFIGRIDIAKFETVLQLRKHVVQEESYSFVIAECKRIIWRTTIKFPSFTMHRWQNMPYEDADSLGATVYQYNAHGHHVTFKMSTNGKWWRDVLDESVVGIFANYKTRVVGRVNQTSKQLQSALAMTEFPVSLY